MHHALPSNEMDILTKRRKVYEEMLKASDRNRLRKWEQDGVTDEYQLRVFSDLNVTRTMSRSRVRG